jgi:uncharacterized protein (DUF2267 family)
MKLDQMVSAVRESARIDTREHAERAVRATVAVLGQRLAGEAADLAAQLPADLADDMPTGTKAERFHLNEFYRRVAEKEGLGCTEAQARQHARATMIAIRESVGAEWQHVLDQLPNDYADLLSTENVQH